MCVFLYISQLCRCIIFCGGDNQQDKIYAPGIKYPVSCNLSIIGYKVITKGVPGVLCVSVSLTSMPPVCLCRFIEVHSQIGIHVNSLFYEAQASTRLCCVLVCIESYYFLNHLLFTLLHWTSRKVYFIYVCITPAAIFPFCFHDRGIWFGNL